jgi:hypothetical protein
MPCPAPHPILAGSDDTLRIRRDAAARTSKATAPSRTRAVLNRPFMARFASHQRDVCDDARGAHLKSLPARPDGPTWGRPERWDRWPAEALAGRPRTDNRDTVEVAGNFVAEN